MKARTPIVSAESRPIKNKLRRGPCFFGIARMGLIAVLSVGLLISTALAQRGGGGGGGAVGGHPANPPAPVPGPQDANFDQSQMVLDSNGRLVHRSEADDRCLLPPLNGTREPVVNVKSMQVSAPARKEYAAACDALKDKKFDRAADHLRKAVQTEPQYSAAWVTLGQLLVAQQKVPEGRDACSHAVTASASYLAGYLCLADISGREQKWDEMLKFSSRAIELDPTNDAVAYGLNAAANLNLHKLPEAEKSGLKAVEIDKTHNDPRIYFLLAQIYETKGEPDNEAAQLRLYLKFTTDPNDAAMVKAYLADLEKRTGK